uniref:Uncharacterized protein n=1 Tax=viral metagenome TaxID=1070528 RepID=A0A6M3L7I8_9ZZZZ
MLVYPRDKNRGEIKHLISNIRKLVNRHKNHCPECGSTNLVGCASASATSASWYEHCDNCGHDFDYGGDCFV